MRNLHDEDDDYDYSPNELANLSVQHKAKYDKIVQSNLESGDTIKDWEQRNLDRMKEFLNRQK